MPFQSGKGKGKKLSGNRTESSPSTSCKVFLGMSTIPNTRLY